MLFCAQLKLPKSKGNSLKKETKGMGKFTKKVKEVLAYMLAGEYVLSKGMKRMKRMMNVIRKI